MVSGVSKDGGIADLEKRQNLPGVSRGRGDPPGRPYFLHALAGRAWKKGTLDIRPSWLPVPSPLQALPLPATPLAAAGFLIRRTTAGFVIPPQQEAGGFVVRALALRDALKRALRTSQRIVRGPNRRVGGVGPWRSSVSRWYDVGACLARPLDTRGEKEGR